MKHKRLKPVAREYRLNVKLIRLEILRVCPMTSCGITKSSEHEAE
jgi:hypothetical protein